MVDETTLEQKRAEAARYRGVSYDRRIDRFVAMITVNDTKRYIGSYLTVGEASMAYEEQRDAFPILRERKLAARSVQKALIDFEESAVREKTKYKNIAAGQILTLPDGQRFRLEGFRFRSGEGWYVWSSRCRCCGALFEQYTWLKIRALKGLTRNCVEHRGAKITELVSSTKWEDPKEWDCEPVVSQQMAAAIDAPKRSDITKSEEHEKVLKLREPVRSFGLKYMEDNPRATRDEAVEAYFSSQNNVSARLEDLGAMAEEPSTDNSDLA